MTAIIPVLNQIQTIKLVDGINREGLTNDQWGIYENKTPESITDMLSTEEGYEQDDVIMPTGSYLIIWSVNSDADWQLSFVFNAVKQNNIPYTKAPFAPDCSAIIFRLSTND